MAANYDISCLPLSVQQSVMQLIETLVATYAPAVGATTDAGAASVPPVYEHPRKRLRRRVLELLQVHPEGLSPAQIRDLLGLTQSLNSVMKGMYRDGLVDRPVEGVYIARALP